MNENQTTEATAPVETPEVEKPIVFTEGQQEALNKFLGFLTNPVETAFVLQGYAGCGKSTLVKELVRRMPEFIQTVKLINPKAIDYEVLLTATTNKAAEALQDILKQSVITIHSALSLRVENDIKTGASKLVQRSKDPLQNMILFIDECSYIDGPLLDFIFKLTKNCKIVFIGDPAQLTPVKSTDAPVFQANFMGAALTEVRRQETADGSIHPITALATRFRDTVNSGEFFSFVPDGVHIKYLERDDFNDAVLVEFNDPAWKHSTSKVLGWTNRLVNQYNHYIRENVSGEPQLQEGDYAICNNFIQLSSGKGIKTDQLVKITRDHGIEISCGITGRKLEVDGGHTVFLPHDIADKKKRMKQAQENEEYAVLREINSMWIDLRAAFACTVNKSQGSTFDRVYIDLDDIRRCNNGNQIARMLYVAVSRARHQVIFTGDIA